MQLITIGIVHGEGETGQDFKITLSDPNPHSPAKNKESRQLEREMAKALRAGLAHYLQVLLTEMKKAMGDDLKTEYYEDEEDDDESPVTAPATPATGLSSTPPAQSSP